MYVLLIKFRGPEGKVFRYVCPRKGPINETVKALRQGAPFDYRIWSKQGYLESSEGAWDIPELHLTAGDQLTLMRSL